VIFTTLHSGGKFRKTDKDAAYRIAGGLHGVGVCVSNALSKRLEVDVKRDGAAYRIVFADNGKVKEPLKKTGTAGPRDTGTRVRFWPDPKYFDSPAIVADSHYGAKAMLPPGGKFSLGIEKARLNPDGHFPEGTGVFWRAGAGRRWLLLGERYVAAQSESDNFARGGRCGLSHGRRMAIRYRVLREHDSGTSVRTCRDCVRASTTPSRTSSTCTPWGSVA
jgi:topoisomerase-4 subunit B